MVSTYTTNKSIEKPGHGDYVDTWEIPVNGDMDIIDQALGGVTNLNATAGSATLTAAQYRSLFIFISGAITSNVTYTIPSGVGGQWVVYNGTTTTNSSTVTISSGGGGTSVLPIQSEYNLYACDGTNMFSVASPTSVPTGGGSDKIFYTNDQTVTASYTLSANQNAMTAGPISINSGATVTIQAGSTWSIV